LTLREARFKKVQLAGIYKVAVLIDDMDVVEDQPGRCSSASAAAVQLDGNGDHRKKQSSQRV
jgi:hypothetical protein